MDNFVLPCAQAELPRLALKHEFLMHCIFAMSAAEAALCARSDVDDAETAMYVRAAMDHYDKGCKAFHAQLLDVNPQNIHSVYMFSFMAMAISMALSQCRHDVDDNQQQESMLGRITGLLELFLGSSSIAVRHMDWLLEGPVLALIFCAGLQLMPAYLQPIGRSTDAALERLALVATTRIFTSVEESQMSQETVSARLESYQNAAMLLRICFSVDINSQANGFCVAFPSLASRDFTAGVKNSEPVALFILLHWAVLLDKLVGPMWWAGSVGQKLVQEISDYLIRSHSQLASTPDWRDSIAWASEQVGIPLLQ